MRIYVCIDPDKNKVLGAFRTEEEAADFGDWYWEKDPANNDCAIVATTLYTEREV